MDKFILNNWFTNELVVTDDMKLVTKTFVELIFAANGGNPQVMGMTTTLTGGFISVSKGLVYFGEVGDSNYQNNTGTNQVIGYYPSGGGIAVIAPTCSVYVEYLIQVDSTNFNTTVDLTVLTSTTIIPNSIKLADINNGVIVAQYNINPLGATDNEKGPVSLNQIRSLITASTFNVGDYMGKAQTIDQNGWLLCNGRAVSRTTYAALFAQIYTIFGAGDGTTTFNLPNANKTVILFANGEIYPGLTSVFGADSRVPVLVAHSHGASDGGHTHPTIDGGHTHPIQHKEDSGFGGSYLSGNNGITLGYIAVTDNAKTGLTIDTGYAAISVNSTGEADPNIPLDCRPNGMCYGNLFIYSGVL